MSIDIATVKSIANLARIDVPDEDCPALAAQLSNILKFAEQLSEVDTKGVEPLTSVVTMKLPRREDVVNDGNYAAALLANAPDKARDEFFAVPKVIE
jgi:aspartyl-tRNA(Asn)/glutamyl-tRNA(Gln) amidotransferase subunit C